MRTCLLALPLLLAAAACSGEPSPATDASSRPSPDGASAAPDGAPDAVPASPDAAISPDATAQPTCSSWHVTLDGATPANVARSATIGDGALDLSVANNRDGECSTDFEPCSAILLSQGPLTGDFDVSLEVDELDGASLFDQVSLITTTGSGGLDAMYDQIAVGGSEGHATLMTEHIAIGSESWSTGSATTHATLRIARVGTQLTLSAVTDSASLSKTYSSSYDPYVAITLDETDDSSLDASTPVHARVSNFVVTGGGGGAVSDDFSGACALIP